ncbi:MAG: methylamine utilization protein, partial [Steroidobacteraceae bacterium]
DAVVYAVPDAPLPSDKARTAIIDQVHRQFAPQVNVVQVGTYVDFPNSDNILHSVYSFSPAKTFVLRLYAGRTEPPVLFNKPGIVVMGCQIHDSMIAWLLVVKTPYFGKTAPDGSLVLRHLRAGNYRVHAWDVGMRKASPPKMLQILAGTRPRQITFRLKAGRMPQHGPTMPGMSSNDGM